MKSWIEISEERLRTNYGMVVRAVAEGSTGRAEEKAEILAVIKANAYGHGLERCGRVLAQGGVEWLGINGVEEGRVLRAAFSRANIGPTVEPRVLVMSGMSREDAFDIVQEGLIPVVWNLEQVGWLAEAVERVGPSKRLGLARRDGEFCLMVEVDSGMTRQGVWPGEALQELVETIGATKGLRVEGVMTHFAAAEVAEPWGVTGSADDLEGMTARQRRVFERAVHEVIKAGAQPRWISVGNTSGVDLRDGSVGMVAWAERLAAGVGARAVVRVGLAFYGYALPLEGVANSRLHELRPVLTWKAKVIGVEDVPVGASVGYNGTFITQRPMRLAVIAAGYADGLRRELSSTNDRAGGWVMVRGLWAPIVGRISMNLTTVDVTQIPDAEIGDEVVLLGDGCTAEDHARLAKTIPYEILCAVRGVERG